MFNVKKKMSSIQATNLIFGLNNDFFEYKKLTKLKKTQYKYCKVENSPFSEIKNVGNLVAH